MTPIEKKEVRGLTIGQIVIVLLFFTSTLYGGITAYNNIMNKLKENEKDRAADKQLYDKDKETQTLINTSVDLKTRELDTRETILETKFEISKKQK